MNIKEEFYTIIYDSYKAFSYYNDTLYLKFNDNESKAKRYNTLEEAIEVIKNIFCIKAGRWLSIRKMGIDNIGQYIWIGNDIRAWDHIYIDKGKFQWC